MRAFPILPLCAVMAMLSGCAVFQGNPKRMDFLLGRDAPSAGSSGLRGPELTVRPFRVSTPYAGQEFVYRTGENRYESDFYNGFFIAPGEMLTEAARQALTRNGPFVLASAVGSERTAPYVLQGHVDTLYGDFRNAEHPIAIIEWRFTLLKVNPPTPVLMKLYSAAIPIRERTPESLVEAWNEGLDDILSQLKRDIREKL